MHARKVHTAVVLSVALVLVAGSLERRRRGQAAAAFEEPRVDLSPVGLVAAEEPLASAHAEVPAEADAQLAQDPEVELAPEGDAEAGPAPAPHRRRGSALTVLALVVVVAAAITTALLTASAGARTAPFAAVAHQSVPAAHR